MPDPFFCLGTPFVGINVTDAFLMDKLSQVDQLFIEWVQRKRAENKHPEICWYSGTSVD
jgi:hypothetical protein